MRNCLRIAAGLPDRLADADLPGPFGDRDQHDDGHPDPADDQRDRRDRMAVGYFVAALTVVRLSRMTLPSTSPILVAGPQRYDTASGWTGRPRAMVRALEFR
jgi:hypothetical protein